jgi:hypothetical protein
MSYEKTNLPSRLNTGEKPVQLHDNGLKAGAFLEQSLAQLTKKQARDLLAKAEEERLRLNAKLEEQINDHRVGRASVEDHIDTFHILDKRGNLTRHNITTDVKTGAGNMRIESKSGPACFVATVAYGDWNHPDVVLLRKFRDEVLVTSSAGRSFIDWYWQTGPCLARVISHSPRLKYCSRWLISCLVSLIRKHF